VILTLNPDIDPDLLGFLPAPSVAAIANIERLKKEEDKAKGVYYWPLHEPQTLIYI